MTDVRFNSPPGWPRVPDGWVPPAGWTPDPSWRPAPPDSQFWVSVEGEPIDAIRSDESPSNDGNPPHEQIGTEAAPTTSSASAAPVPVVTGRHAAPTTSSAGAAGVPVVTGRHAAVATTLPAVMAAAPAPDPLISRAAAPPYNERDIESPARRVEEAERRIRALEQEEQELRERIIELRDSVALQDAGLYDYHHPLENADLYKPMLAGLQARMTEMIRRGRAVIASNTFSYNNSLALGRKMTSDFSRLMLRAYNAEADISLRSLRAGNVAAAVKRLESSAKTIARLGTVMEMRIAPEYHELRVQEIRLTADYLTKSQEEKEAAREDRARLREEHKAQEELARDRERLDKERKRCLDELHVLEEKGKEKESGELQERLAQIDAAIEQNEQRAANLRAGYVYVISNIGSFGGEVVKIGMTRRLDPIERVRELDDASVPFPFDVHAVCFSDDAVALESELHAQFASCRLNNINLRREFFFATPHEVREALAAKVGNRLDFVEAPDAVQYYQSRGTWPEQQRGKSA
jgi:Domain of unknown function (DUF4041)/Meiotically up-regulated gene 113